MSETDPFDDGRGPETGPVDHDILDRIAGYLSGSTRFATVVGRPDEAPQSVVAEYDMGYFPAAIERAALRIRWYETDDFTVHYSEEYRDGTLWECRWDRHPNEHNSRSHVHPPPDAETPGDDADLPGGWRDLLSTVLGEVDSRIESFWE